MEVQIQAQQTPRQIMYPVGVGSLVTRVIEAGTGHRYMVLVHGIGSHAGWWRMNIPALADSGFHVFAFDFPGHGFASKREVPELSIDAYARFLADVLQKLSIDRAVLVGHSLGGQVVGLHAIRSPNSVTGLVLVAPTGVTAVGEERRQATQSRQSETSREAIEAKLRFAIYDPKLITEDWISEDHMINNSPGAQDALGRIARYVGEQLDDHVIGRELSLLTKEVPTLLVWGSEDRSLPVEYGSSAHDLLPSSRLAVFEGAAHVPNLECAELFNRVVVDFLAGSRTEAAGLKWE